MLTATASGTKAGTQKKIFGSSTTAIKISIEEMEDMKTLKSLEELDLLRKDVNATIKNEANECG